MKTKRRCKNGHFYYKSSDCPVCPICAKNNKPEAGFLSILPGPAVRALTNAGITTDKKLISSTEEGLLQLHGFGPGSIAKLKEYLQQLGKDFRR